MVAMLLKMRRAVLHCDACSNQDIRNILRLTQGTQAKLELQPIGVAYEAKRPAINLSLTSLKYRETTPVLYTRCNGLILRREAVAGFSFRFPQP